MRVDIEVQSLRALLITAGTVEARDPYTVGHQWRMTALAQAMGQRLGMDEGQLFALGIAAHVHDLGMVGIPNSLLQKPSTLSKEEFAVIRTHPLVGEDLVRSHPSAEFVLDVVRHHHERVDGNGYPDKLTGDMLSTNAKILAIVDAFDALTSTRPYSPAMPIGRAGAALESGRNTQFDGNLLDVFFELAKSGALNRIVGHSDEGCPLLTCERAGTVIQVPRGAKDGDEVICRASALRYRIKKNGDHFKPELVGAVENAADLRPQPDHGVIERLLETAPSAVEV